MQESLTVYRASAGSGKTFRLAVEYIKMLIQNPTNFRNILAVTFTNKATEEMKMRILGTLYGLSRGLESSNDYLEAIRKDTKFDEETIRNNAGLALVMIVHSYQYFRVETIDSFFQSVLRNLARELGLNANLRVELNDKQVEEESVDQMIESLEESDRVLTWIMEFINQNMQDDKSWNVISELKIFGRNIFLDEFKDNKKAMDQRYAEKDFFKNISSKLYAIKKDSENFFNDIASSFRKIESRYSLTVDDYKYTKSGAWTYFKKIEDGKYSDGELLGKRFLDALDNPNAWLSKKNSPAGQDLTDLAQKSEQDRGHYALQYYSALFTLQNLYKIRLLRYIDESVEQKNKELNRFLLSNTQTLLAGMISDTDSPFIYEKIGAQIHHIMIDEFQDTSRTQWKNFLVLLKECMSKASGKDNGIAENLIVGDVKQSIYRWRNSDWRLLNNIDRTFQQGEVLTQPMEINYRSTRNVVYFNNDFFIFANQAEARLLENEVSKIAHADKSLLEQAKEIERAYAGLKQEVPDSKPAEGYVEIELFPQKAKDDGPSYDERILAKTKDIIEDLVYNQHVALKDIAILSRSRSDITHIVDYFMGLPDNKIKFVSDEAYRLKASPAVNIIITALRIIADPTNLYYTALAAHLYQEYKLGNENNLIEMAAPQKKQPKDDDESQEKENVYLQHLVSFLPDHFYDHISSTAAQPLIDMVEEIKSKFGLNDWANQSAYLCFFSDQLTSYLENNPGNVADFLKFWDETLNQKSITDSQSNGIRLLTIHQSKGLEFKYVLIPYCDWPLEKYNDTLWTNPKESPYNELIRVPVVFQQKLVNSIYARDYETEHQQVIVDNLNLLYVAFTRARNGLYVMGKRRPKAKKGEAQKWNVRSYIIEDYLNQKNVKESDDGSLFYSTGCQVSNQPKSTAKKKDELPNIFEMEPEPLPVEIKPEHHKVVFIQSNQSKQFFDNGQAEPDEDNDYIRLGDILHQLFSTIVTEDDVDAKLAEFEFNGLINNKFINRDQVVSQVKKAFLNPQVKEWFRPGLRLMNECNILSTNPKDGTLKTDRPDRVMIDGNNAVVVDFKFGKVEAEHESQVQRYMSLLQQMGYKEVKGYVWYVFLDCILEVH